ncbi:fungal specific transcription factor domain-containing protein [Aspergillus undulatus]|uniref:fungal specific transcription factor domain-containing protein n=1 Tax=Aspergillus undulatus TaxID=1810928 RepID=UPI003CCCF571
MLALGARFSDDPLFGETDRRRRGDEYAKRARSLLDLTEISVTTIQACILLGTISFSDSQMESEALYYSVALRLALILDLPQKHCSGRLDREINLRIWWSLYMIDIWSSMGLDLSRQLDFVDEYSLPTNEEDFLSITGGQSMTNAACPGLWSEMAKLTRIWARIHSFNKESLNRSINNHSLCVTIDNLAIELREWANGLPASLRETPANLDRYKALGLGNAFAALHLGYHYYNEVLFYQFLARNPTSTRQHDDIKSRYQARCEEHALAFCNLLYACRSANSQPNYQCLYVMVGHMLVVTSTVYIHMLLFSPELEKVELARHRLAKNFEILTQLRTFWATLDVALSRLQAFHNACRRSIEGSFRMDTWMLKFILEHGSSVGERPVAAGSMGDGNGEEPNALNSWFLRNF